MKMPVKMTGISDILLHTSSVTDPIATDRKEYFINGKGFC
jgi:hypothetical protein